jgi:hypothetical protein
MDAKSAGRSMFLAVFRFYVFEDRLAASNIEL